jgi:hypothetical protein
MSDEQRKDHEDEAEVEGHLIEEASKDEPAEEDDSEVEAHVQRTSNLRME